MIEDIKVYQYYQRENGFVSKPTGIWANLHGEPLEEFLVCYDLYDQAGRRMRSLNIIKLSEFKKTHVRRVKPKVTNGKHQET